MPSPASASAPPVCPPPSPAGLPCTRICWPFPASNASQPELSALAVFWTRLFGKPPTAWTRTVCSAVLAVIGVNGVLAAFLLAAFGEKSAEEVAKKED